ncbi:ABC transporter ATP-binding protein [Vibrio variabilis]|uniref:ABC transporter ATP-binding protein n=1 Tax=Vibrio variabilis TaxID=990271 RepID=UPI000DD7D11A|nr:ABC transporter ATP-binding protein [Vibrio variabilis]
MSLTFSNLNLNVQGKTLLSDVSGTFRKEVTALVGPNGSGKSTLLSVVSGLCAPTSGDVTLEGAPLSNLSKPHLARSLALLPQRNPLPATLTVKELVAFGRHPHKRWYQRSDDKDRALIEWAMRETEVSGYQDTPLTSLSGGELQRCWLAMVLAQDTPILMLDEPTSWLDIAHQINLLTIVRRLNTDYGKTVVWVLHDLNQAKLYSDNAMLISEGSIVAQGKVSEVLAPDVISDIYHTPIKQVNVDGQWILWPEAQR